MMVEEQKLEAEESEVTETRPEVDDTKTEPVEQKTEYKRTDYEYKSWSRGIAVPDGWERCQDHADVIRRLKVVQPKVEASPAEARAMDTVPPQNN